MFLHIRLIDLYSLLSNIKHRQAHILLLYIYIYILKCNLFTFSLGPMDEKGLRERTTKDMMREDTCLDLA